MTARQSLGLSVPMVLGHLMIVEIQGVDLILSLVPKMNMHEVPSSYVSLANNIIKGLRSGSVIFGLKPTCQHTTNLSEFSAKQVLCRPESYSKQGPNAKTLRPDIKTMVSLTKLTVPFAAPEQLSWCVNPNQWKSARLESNLRFCGETWQISSKVSSLVEKTKVHSSSQRSALAHMSSALKIEETVLENQCSNLLLLEVDSWSLVSLNLSVPGVSPQMLQRVLSQVNKANV